MSIEHVRTWCPKCKHVVIADQNGFGQCSRCGQYFMLKRKQKQNTLEEGVK